MSRSLTRDAADVLCRIVRWPSFDADYWQLESAEQRHASSPETFWIPALAEREGLRVGDSVKLLFAIEGEEDNGSLAVQVERMWVLVTEVHPEAFIGVLLNDPASIGDDSDFYLRVGAEVPFRAEHVAAIGSAPDDFVEQIETRTPTRRWDRDPGQERKGRA